MFLVFTYNFVPIHLKWTTCNASPSKCSWIDKEVHKPCILYLFIGQKPIKAIWSLLPSFAGQLERWRNLRFDNWWSVIALRRCENLWKIKLLPLQQFVEFPKSKTSETDVSLQGRITATFGYLIPQIWYHDFDLGTSLIFKSGPAALRTL